jgi:hypothetical protein
MYTKHYYEHIEQKNRIKRLGKKYLQLQADLTADDWRSMRTIDYWRAMDKLCDDLDNWDCQEQKLIMLIEVIEYYNNEKR